MTPRSTAHATFSIERTYDAAPERVFAAWADPAAKSRWFGGPDDGETEYELDFRVGGRERSRGGTPDGTVYTYDAVYRDIAPNERIVYTYEMYMGEARISVSVTTVELAPEAAGTRLTFTEHGVFLDGLDSPALREEGTGHLLDALGADLRGEKPAGW
ncbi:MAG: putative glutathione S-transferase-related transrane protein [Actinomycetia bacterium]|jgi:uncharacterized protein YndB with AHSA1/START domain|nr:putative glutathione S-transferase-related transrane protein [Actinomycetes bacterium]